MWHQLSNLEWALNQFKLTEIFEIYRRRNIIEYFGEFGELFLSEWNIPLHHKGLFPELFLLHTAYVMKVSQAFVVEREV